jgi:hypothetical protein
MRCLCVRWMTGARQPSRRAAAVEIELRHRDEPLVRCRRSSSTDAMSTISDIDRLIVGRSKGVGLVRVSLTSLVPRRG